MNNTELARHLNRMNNRPSRVFRDTADGITVDSTASVLASYDISAEEGLEYLQLMIDDVATHDALISFENSLYRVLIKEAREFARGAVSETGNEMEA